MVARRPAFASTPVTDLRRLIATAAAVLALPAVIAACTSDARLPADPVAVEAQAQPIDVTSRYLVARDITPLVEEGHNAFRRELAWRASTGQTGPLPPADVLAISGGGDEGAFGAGLLIGWSATGKRPEFKFVTGVSTGALTAPFAFLGPKYDYVLKEVYTEVSQKDIFKKKNVIVGVLSDSMADTTPLYRLIQRHVDRKFLDEIAAEYAKGRLLLVGTTNLDSMEPVVWNMTAIAASKDPRALTLFRRVLLASAAIPGAFPPVMIDVQVNGVHYQEMHVDGGAERQVFAYPPSLNLQKEAAEFGAIRERHLYVIRNARLDTNLETVKLRTFPIAARAVVSLMDTQGVGDLYRIYAVSKKDGVDYNLAYIPSDFNVVHKEEFDTHYMRELFNLGQTLAAAGYPWQKYPPGYDSPIESAEQHG
ncbi:MAG TPA: patatin-like phospholipase family protein [Caulobacteraceae bacterium]|jgi:predicted patatin/cPLA2 family phospholipase